jgi:integrase
MAIHKLKWGKVQSLTENGMHSDGGNLYLSVTHDGAGKSWVFRWTIPGTRRDKMMGLGPIHTVDLEEAREKARECRKLLMAGKDPRAERDGVRLDQAAARGLAKTVSQVVDEYFDARIAHKTGHLIKSFNYCFRNPVREKIGDMPIQKVDTNTILKTLGLEALWTEQHPTAERLLSRLRLLFKFAKAKGYYRGDKTSPTGNPAEWKNHLENVLPASKDIHDVKHHPSLPYKDIGRFMALLRNWEDKSARRQGHTAQSLLIEFIILSGVRLSEARLAKWGEFDFDTMIWNVPWQHRKARGQINKGNGSGVHPVPITPPMLAVLQEMRRRPIDQSPDALVFPSPHGGEHNEGSTSNFIHFTLRWQELVRQPDGSMKRITLHGFRSTLKDWSRANKYPDYQIELQLDHVLGNTVGQSYGHDKLVEERRAMMRMWGDYCAQPAPEPATGTDNVSQINEARKKRRKAS